MTDEWKAVLTVASSVGHSVVQRVVYLAVPTVVCLVESSVECLVAQWAE